MTQRVGGGGRAERARDPRSAATVALVTAGALTILDVSKVGVALPVIQESFGDGATGQVALQLMMIGYTVAYAVLLLPSGRLGDIVSRKKVFMVGLIAFIAASALCALAPTASWLVAGRILQGAGAGVLMPQVVGLIQRLYVPADRGRPLAALAVTTAVTAAVGPVLAGLIMEAAPGDAGWRWLFWLNVIVGAALLPVAWRAVTDVSSGTRPGYDWRGALLLAVALILVIMPLGTVNSLDSISPITTISLLTGLAVGIVFVRRSRRIALAGVEPLMDLDLLRCPGFSSGLTIAGLMHACGTSSALIVTMYLQQAAGLSPLLTALTMIFSAVFVTVASTLTGRMRVQKAWSLIWVGTFVSTLAMGGVAYASGHLPTSTAVLAVAALWAINGLGTGMVSAPNQSRTLSMVPEYRASVAGSAIQLVQRVSSAVGMGLALVIYFALGNGAPGGGSPGAGAALAISTGYLAAALIMSLIERRRSIPPVAPAS